MRKVYRLAVGAALVVAIALTLCWVAGAVKLATASQAVSVSATALQVSQGMWYAINTGGLSYRVFYLSGGSEVYVTAFRWDANASYIIFQAPCNCTVYLRREDYSMGTLDTSSWFPARRVTLNITLATRVLGPGGAEFMPWARQVVLRRSATSISISRVYRPSAGVVVTNTSTFSFVATNTQLVLATTALATKGATYVVHSMVITNATTAQRLTLNITGLKAQLYFCNLATPPSCFYEDDVWAVSVSGQDVLGSPTSYTLASNSTANAWIVANRGSSVTTTTYEDYAFLSSQFIRNELQVTHAFSVVGATASSVTTYPVANGVITAANGNRVAVFDRLPPPVALSANGVVYIYRPAWVNITSPATLSNASISFPSASITWINGSGATANGPVSVHRVEQGRLNATHVYLRILYSPLPGFPGGQTTVTANGAQLPPVQIQRISSYSLSLSAPQYATVGDTPAITVATNHTGRIAVHNLEAYLNLTPPAPVQPGDVLAPHLYDWSFDGVDDYIVVGVQPDGRPFTVYGWIGISLSMRAYIYRPKPLATVGSAFSIGSYGSGYLITFRFEEAQMYNWCRYNFLASGTLYESPNLVGYTNSWRVYGITFSTFSRVLRFYVDSTVISSATVPQTSILEIPPPGDFHRRLVVGAHINFADFVKMDVSYITINSVEDRVDVGNVVDASNLRLFLDATAFDGTHYIDLSGNNNHGRPYNGVARVPANQTWLWIVRGMFSDGLVRFRFFPNGTMVVFSDGTAVAVTGPVNGAGLVEEFVIARSDVRYILVPSPRDWGRRNMLTRSDVGVVRLVVWMDAPAVYPARFATVVFDKVVLRSFSVSVPNGTRVDAFRTAVQVSVELIHAFDNTPVLPSPTTSVTLAGAAATYDQGSGRWVASINPPGSVGARVYPVVSGAVSQRGVRMVDPSPRLLYVWDALRIASVSVDYLREVANVTVVYASDGSPPQSITIAVEVGGARAQVSGAWGVAQVDLKPLPANITSLPLVYPLSDGGRVSTSVQNATVPFLRLSGSRWRVKVASPPPPLVRTVSRGSAMFFRVRSYGRAYMWLDSVPSYVYSPGGFAVVPVGSAHVVWDGGDLVAVVGVDRATVNAVAAPAPGKGEFAIGFTSDPTRPLGANYSVYILVNGTGAFLVRSAGRFSSAVAVGLGIRPPAVVSYVHTYDAAGNMTDFCFLIVYWESATRYLARCLRVPGQPPALYPFAYGVGSIFIDRFAATLGTSIKWVAYGEVSISATGPLPSTTLLKYVQVDRPVVISLTPYGISVEPGGGSGITFKGFAGYRLSFTVGGVTASNILIPSNTWVLDIPLGFSAFVAVDPTAYTIVIISTAPMKGVEVFSPTPGFAPVPAPPWVVDINIPSPALTPIAVVMFAAAVSATVVAVYRSTGRIHVGLAVGGAVSSLVGVAYVASGLVAQEVGVSMIAGGIMLAAVALALSAGRE